MGSENKSDQRGMVLLENTVNGVSLQTVRKPGVAGDLFRAFSELYYRRADDGGFPVRGVRISTTNRLVPD